MVKPMQPVMPPPFISPDALVGLAVYGAKAMPHGHDDWETRIENIPQSKVER
jgi:pyruvate dehydrogenase (quinone)